MDLKAVGTFSPSQLFKDAQALYDLDAKQLVALEEQRAAAQSEACALAQQVQAERAQITACHQKINRLTKLQQQQLELADKQKQLVTDKATAAQRWGVTVALLKVIRQHRSSEDIEKEQRALEATHASISNALKELDTSEKLTAKAETHAQKVTTFDTQQQKAQEKAQQAAEALQKGLSERVGKCDRAAREWLEVQQKAVPPAQKVQAVWQIFSKKFLSALEQYTSSSATLTEYQGKLQRLSQAQEEISRLFESYTKAAHDFHLAQGRIEQHKKEIADEIAELEEEDLSEVRYQVPALNNLKAAVKLSLQEAIKECRALEPIVDHAQWESAWAAKNRAVEAAQKALNVLKAAVPLELFMRDLEAQNQLEQGDAEWNSAEMQAETAVLMAQRAAMSARIQAAFAQPRETVLAAVGQAIAQSSQGERSVDAKMIQRELHLNAWREERAQIFQAKAHIENEIRQLHAARRSSSPLQPSAEDHKEASPPALPPVVRLHEYIQQWAMQQKHALNQQMVGKLQALSAQAESLIVRYQALPAISEHQKFQAAVQHWKRDFEQLQAAYEAQQKKNAEIAQLQHALQLSSTIEMPPEVIVDGVLEQKAVVQGVRKLLQVAQTPPATPPSLLRRLLGGALGLMRGIWRTGVVLLKSVANLFIKRPGR